MKERPVGDVSGLPTWGFGSSSTPWWGTLAFVGIEGTGFVLAIGAYLYLAAVNAHWPPAVVPNHWPGTIMTVVLLASLVPNWWADHVASQQQLRLVRIALVVMTVIG